MIQQREFQYNDRKRNFSRYKNYRLKKYNNPNFKTHYISPIADLRRAKDSVSELEDRSIEIIRSEEYREQKDRKKMNRPSEACRISRVSTYM